MANENIRLGDRLEAMDKEVRGWARLTKQKLLFKLASLNLEERIRLTNDLRLKKSVRDYVRKKGGELDAVAFSFARQGIFIEHGVGRGRPVRSAQAEANKQPWLKPVLSASIEDLANLLADEYADIAAAEVKINIPGIITTIK